MLIKRLSSGGIIANYRCSAACGHCVYGCSPSAEAGYMDMACVARLAVRLRSLGCSRLHIGGGEPFLEWAKLVTLIRAMRANGLSVDYIETNASWISGDCERDRKILNEVMNAGGNCIMVSADPFHVEFVPFWKNKALIDLLKSMRVPHFVWQDRYLPMLLSLDPHKKYDTEALRDVLGYDATAKCATEYGMRFNGRALNLLRKQEKLPPHRFFAPCPELLNTNHFHVDFLGNYVPPGCTGLGIAIDDIGKALDPSAYPVISRLLSGGVGELYSYAMTLGYNPKPEGYVSKCELCFDLRKFLINETEIIHNDLTPKSFYKQDY